MKTNIALSVAVIAIVVSVFSAYQVSITSKSNDDISLYLNSLIRIQALPTPDDVIGYMQSTSTTAR